MILKKKQRQEAATQSQFYNSENQTPEGHDDDTNIVVESNIPKIAKAQMLLLATKLVVILMRVIPTWIDHQMLKVIS